MTRPLVDASGHRFEPGPAPRRIVCLVPSTTEILCQLGLADALVGVSVYCVEPRDVVGTLPRVGGEKNPDLDRIAALHPDLVVANIEENLRPHVEALRALGIPVWVTYPRTAEDVVKMIRELGEVAGTPARAAAMADELEGLVGQARETRARHGAVRVFYPIWRDPYMTVNADTYVHEVLALCGGENVFADHPIRYPTVSLAEVAARRPEVILLPDEPFRFRRAHVQDFAAYTDVPAVRHGRLHLIDGKLCAWHGPRLAQAVRRLPGLLEAASGDGGASWSGEPTHPGPP